ncbi:MAG: hypothetical protein K2M01_05070 [Paramuribaculum sp.]|nr:hypothetical protein [Paramuribaculum sp.]
MSIINNTSDNFQLQYKKELTELKSTLVMSLIGCVAMATLSGFLAGTIGLNSTGIMLYIPCCALALCIAASMMFGPLKRKTDTIAMLMTPSSMKAKFMVRWLAVVPALIITLFLGGFIFELFRMMAQALYHDHSQFIVPYFGMIKEYFSEGETPIIWSMIFLAITYIGFSQSLYMIGGVVWPRLSFLKTMLALWGVQVALQIITFPLMQPVIIPFLQNILTSISTPDSVLLWINGTTVMMLGLTALCWWISYRLFTKVDINRFSSRK